jgi:inositol transport system permease protein
MRREDNKTMEATNKTNFKKRLGKIYSRYGIFFVLLFLMVVCAIISPNFLTADNLLNVLRQTSVVALIAFAETVLIISGNIDLSAGSTMCLAGIVGITGYQLTNSIILAICFSIATAIICNVISGSLVAYLGLPSFISTLAMQQMARGAVLIYTGGVIITQTGKKFPLLGQGHIGPIPIPIIVMFVVAIFLWIVLDKTRFGRNLFAIGGNKEAARASGINVKNYTLKSFIFSAIFIGIGGYMFASRVNSGIPTAGAGYEGNGISAAIIGGVGFSGGTGSAWGVIVGAMIMGIISNILNLLRVDSYVQQVVNGAIIVLAVVLDLQTKKKRIGQ